MDMRAPNTETALLSRADLTSILPDEEVARILGEMWPTCDEPATPAEEAWTNATADIAEAAEAAHRETKSWLALYERQLTGEHVAYQDALDARERLQDAHWWHANLAEIASIGRIAKGWCLRPDAEGLYTLARDGGYGAHGADDGADLVMTVPRGLTTSGYRAIVNAYRTGSEHGRRELQNELRSLLDGVV